MKYLAFLFLLTTSCVGIHVLNTKHVQGADGNCYEEDTVYQDASIHTIDRQIPCVDKLPPLEY